MESEDELISIQKENRVQLNRISELNGSIIEEKSKILREKELINEERKKLEVRSETI